jgi:L-alanine-DL-glutamate epimerase-like enolase superfamily enzyme
LKITKISSVLLATPLRQPILTAIHHFDRVFHVVVQVETDSGLSGTGLLFAQSAPQGRLFQAALATFEDKLIGEDPLRIEGIWQKLWKAMNFIGNSGVSIFALSAIDTALWDILGKEAGKPLYRLLGQHATSIPVYASQGLWLGTSPDNLVKEVEDYVARGFKVIKIRVGLARLEDDLARVKLVQEAAGSGIRFIADANQGWDAATAIRFGRLLEDAGINLLWLEEPVPYYDLASSAAIATALDTALGTGESEYTYLGFARLGQERAADIWMPDLQRVGGVTGWRKIAHLAESYQVPVSPHLFPEVSVHLALAAANCQILEYVDWWEVLLEDAEYNHLLDGCLNAPTQPGLGFTIQNKTIEKYAV